MKIKKWPERKKWRWFFKALNKKEKVIFAFFAVLFFLSFFFIVRSFYFKNTEIKPAFGGTYIEGVIEEPRFINPIYLESDIDKDLTEIIFSGLLKYNENMEIVPDLAERYEIEEDGRVYRFRLKENLVWQNSQPLTAEDVVFTIKTIQNPDYKSHFRPNFLGIEVKTISDLEIEFRLKKPYSSFLENLTIKIMPKHIWQDVTPQKFFSDPHHL